MKKIYALLAVCLMQTACGEDFLDKTPEDKYEEENFFSSDDALKAATAPLYTRAWFDYNSGSIVYIGSQRANEAYSPWGEPEWTTFQVTALHSGLINTWKGFYGVVTMANSVIESVKTKCTGSVTEQARREAIGEARLMRGVAYFYLLRLWGPVILFENNQQIVDNPLRPRNLESDVLQFIINDFTYASENLPEKASASGRATKWAAETMLAKAYLARSGWDKSVRDESDLAQARKYAADVCENSGLELLPSYENLFKYKYNNNQESLLAMQWVPLGDWYVRNTQYSALSISAISGGVAVWGAPEGTYDQMMQYEENDTLRMNATFMTVGTHYSYLNIADGGYTYDGETAMNKKGAIGGPNDDNDGLVAVMCSPLNTYICRLADAYLTYAEACLGNSEALGEGKGLEYFNKVRRRAGLGDKFAITFDDIIRERRCEFGMEYVNWYEMTTWYKWKPDYMLHYFNDQKRGVRAHVERDSKGRRVITEEVIAQPDFDIVVNKDNVFFPYPEADVLQNPLLREAPVAYEFSE